MKKISLFILSLLLMASCSQDQVGSVEVGETAKVHFTLSTAPMTTKVLGNVPAVTRSTTTSTVDENQISDLMVVQYQVNGGVLKSQQLSAVSSVFDLSLIAGIASNIYFVANVGGTYVPPSTEAGFKTSLKTITTEAALMITDANNGGKKSIPMYGSILNVTVPTSGLVMSSDITLTRMLARIDFTYSVDAAFASSIALEKIRLCNVPTGATYYPPAPATTTATPPTGVTTYKNYLVETPVTSSTPTTLTFYVPENQQGIDTSNNDEKTKSGANNANATYVEITAHTLGAQEGRECSFRVYPGANNSNDYNVVRNTKYSVATTIYGANNVVDKRIKVRELSNCYVLISDNPDTNELSSVNISLLKANVSGLGTQIPDVRTLTASQISVSWSTYADILTLDCSNLTKGYFTVKCKNTSIGYMPGNAVVVVKDGTAANSKILWSWHIWMMKPDKDPRSNLLETNIAPAGTIKWMKYNIGAFYIAGDLVGGSYMTLGGTVGMLYQWGRKDPFVGAEYVGGMPVAIYGYTPPTSYGSLAPTMISSNDNTKYLQLTSATYSTQLALSVQYPMLFLGGWGGSTANAVVADQSAAAIGADSWGGSAYKQPKSAYDPCPEGYRVPSFYKNSSTRNSPWTGIVRSRYDPGDAGFITTTNHGNYPGSGYRLDSSGAFSGQGEYGFCWSATTSSYKGDMMYYNPTTAYDSGASPRAVAYPVRCVAE